MSLVTFKAFAALLSCVAAAPQYGLPSSAAPPNYNSPAVSSSSFSYGGQQSPNAMRSWDEGAVYEYPIHQSCNGSETLLLRQALAEAEILASHARDHIQRYGNASIHYKKYFGDAATGEPAGWFDKIVHGDKAGVLFRCDDPDMNCATQEGWAGHWRGENGTDESVICELSFIVKKPIWGMCGYSYQVASHSTTFYFGSDLIHRLYHTDKIGEGVVGHYADTYQECLELATESSELAVRNSASLRYFALDVYAFDIAVPGEGCTGEPVPEDTSSSASSTSATATSSVELSSMVTSTTETTIMTTAPSEAQITSEASSTTANAASTTGSPTTSAASECHTHADGEVHCV